MTDIKEKTSCSSSDIYYRMLQIGSEHTEKGISLTKLKTILQTECLVSNPENTEHIEDWFNWAFEHKRFGCHCPTRDTTNDCGCKDDDPCNSYDHINNCNRYLNKTSIIEFAQLEQSHKLNEQIILNKKQLRLLQTQIDTANSDAFWSKIFAISALIVSSFSLIPDWYEFLFDNTNSQESFQISKSIKEEESHQTKELLLATQTLDKILDNLHNPLPNRYLSSEHKTDLSKILIEMQTLNKTLKRDKK